MGKEGIRRKHDPVFKAKVALEALKGQETMTQLSSRYGVHSGQISRWRRTVKEGLPDLFRNGRKRSADSGDDALVASLYEQIGRLKMELEWLKKKSDNLY